MTVQIPATYTDKTGTIATTITNDGETFTMNLDRTIFHSRFLDDFEPKDPAQLPERFTLDHLQSLTACTIDCKLPVGIVIDNRLDTAWFATVIHLSPELNTPFFEVNFEWEDKIISLGSHDFFEEVFERLKSKLPEGVALRACYACQYSDYSVYGSQAFGSMLCFRNRKAAYLQVKSKDGYMKIMDQRERVVQETYLCDDFERRGDSIGYRG
jgi:hypothetical protein